MHRLQRTWTAFRGLPWILRFGAGLALAIFAMLLLPAGAHAEDRVARQGNDEVVISDTPCTHAGTLIQIDKLAPGQREQYQRAMVRYQGQAYYACWIQMGGVVSLIYEDGDQGIVPLVELRPVPSI